MALGKRIRDTLEERGRTQAWLCAAANVDTGTLSAIIQRDSKRSEFSEQIAAALGVFHRWLQTGEGPRWAPLNHVAREPDLAYAVENAVLAPKTRRGVPIIDTINAGTFAQINCDLSPGEGDDWEVPDHQIGQRGWAHIVDGPSMDDGTPEGFPHGTLIFCDPDVAPYPNAFVIAKDTNGQRATFKQLVTDGGKWYLRPLNKQFPITEIDDPSIRVIAVVTEARPRSRKLR